MTGAAPRYDWNDPIKPVGAQLWIADHRLLVRCALFLVDLALVVALIASLINGDVWWVLLLQMPAWAWMTYQGGWVVPGLVDRWRARQDRAGERSTAAPSDVP